MLLAADAHRRMLANEERLAATEEEEPPRFSHSRSPLSAKLKKQIVQGAAIGAGTFLFVSGVVRQATLEQISLMGFANGNLGGILGNEKESSLSSSSSPLVRFSVYALMQMVLNEIVRSSIDDDGIINGGSDYDGDEDEYDDEDYNEDYDEVIIFEDYNDSDYDDSDDEDRHYIYNSDEDEGDGDDGDDKNCYAESIDLLGNDREDFEEEEQDDCDGETAASFLPNGLIRPSEDDSVGSEPLVSEGSNKIKKKQSNCINWIALDDTVDNKIASIKAFDSIFSKMEASFKENDTLFADDPMDTVDDAITSIKTSVEENGGCNMEHTVLFGDDLMDTVENAITSIETCIEQNHIIFGDGLMDTVDNAIASTEISIAENGGNNMQDKIVFDRTAGDNNNDDHGRDLFESSSKTSETNENATSTASSPNHEDIVAAAHVHPGDDKIADAEWVTHMLLE